MTGAARVPPHFSRCGFSASKRFGNAVQRNRARRRLREVTRDLPFYEVSGGGVTVSGGEPLAQIDFLDALLRACRAHGLHTALDTSGYAPWEALDRVRAQVELFLYDLKLMDEERHRRFTGVSNGAILGNLRALSERGHRIVVRVPVIEGVNDDPASMDAIAAFAAGLPRVEAIELLRGHRFASGKYERLGRRPPEAGAAAAERLAGIAARMREHDLVVRAGGG